MGEGIMLSPIGVVMTKINPRVQSMEEEVRERLGDDAADEMAEEDPVRGKIIFHRFTSRSKGIRRTKAHPEGYRRYRNGVREVHLLKRVCGLYGFTQWHRFPFDEVATELGVEDGEVLKEHIDRVWGY